MSRAEKAKSDLLVRAVAGVVMIAVALAAVYLGGWWFRLLGAAAAAMMMYEWADMHGMKGARGLLSAALMGAALVGIAEYLHPAALPLTPSALDANWRAFLAIGGVAVVVGLLCRNVKMGWGFVYIGIPSFCLLSLDQVSAALIAWVFAVTWAVDICAYFAGRSIGGPKLAPRISPNKTWAGLLGGMAGAALFGWLVARGFDMGSFFLWAGAPMGFVAQMGDLYESWEKRRAGIKDSGSLLPGHGGVLDRLDGLLAASLATTLLLMAGL